MKKCVSAFVWFLITFAASAQYNSLLWKITGNGLKEPSYLFGTMHTSDKRVIALGDSALQYFDHTRAYAMELDPKKTMDMGMVTRLMMGKGYSLKKMIPAREYGILDSLVRLRVGFSLNLFDNVAPVFIMAIIETEMLGLEESEDKKNDEVLDLYFYKKAKRKHKSIIGIETMEEQLDALNSISYEEQVEMLVQEVNNLQEQSEDAQNLVRFYLEQKLDSLAIFETGEDMPIRFYEALVTSRNRRMADRLPAHMEKQPTFIAVGALHLTGEQGVISLLRRKGYTVEAVR